MQAFIEDNVDTAWYNQRFRDEGPFYVETDPDHLIVEPWNGFSSLLVVFVALYWAYKIRNNPGNFKFLTYSIPLIILGGLGSTFFHLFRSSVAFLIMDVLPTAILTLSIGIYFWIKVLKKWWYVLLIIIPVFGLRLVLFNNLPSHTAINISYALVGITIFLPLSLVLYKSRFFKVNFIILTLISFILALLFRELDPVSENYLPMGSHFLWHVFSAVGGYFILAYLYHFRLMEMKQKRFK